MGHLKGFSPECNLMWRNKFPFWVKEAPHWLHWNGLSPMHTEVNPLGDDPFCPQTVHVPSLLVTHPCGYACEPSVRWVRCRSSRTPHTGASHWAAGWVLAKQRSDWRSHCKGSLCLFQRRRTLHCLLPWAPLCHLSCCRPSQPLCSPAVEHLVTHHHCTAQL